MNKITLTEAELRDALEDGETETLETERWRHGHTSRIRIVRDGKSYAVWLRFHHDDGLQVFGNTDLHEVFPVEKTITTWEHAKP